MSETELLCEAADLGSGRLRVGYVLKQYPRLSETFILNEILGLEHQHVEVSVFSLRPATEGRFHSALADVQAPVRYLSDLDKATFVDALGALTRLRVGRLAEVLEFFELLPAARRPRLLLQAIELADQVRAAEIDHLHAHFMTVASHTVHAAHLLTGVPYTVTAHAKDIYRHTVDWTVARHVANSSEAIVTVCDANLAFLQSRLGEEARVVRIYNGLSPQVAAAASEPRQRDLVVGVGRLVDKKGFDVFLDVVAALPEIRAVIVGDGENRAALETQAVTLGITDRVEFVGAQPQSVVAQFLRRATVMVAPCRIGADGNQDALPTVLLEALAAGLPVVTTPVAGIPEIIGDGIEGTVVAEADASLMAPAVARLLDDVDLWSAMSGRGPVKLHERFDRSKTIEQLIELFRADALVRP